jgi:hypothetical protein
MVFDLLFELPGMKIKWNGMNLHLSVFQKGTYYAGIKVDEYFK